MTARIAFRNVFRNRRRSAITLLVIVFGAVGLILFGGYKQQTFRALRESTIRSRLGHLQIYKRGFASNESKKPLEYGLDDVAALRSAVESDTRVKMTAAQITLMGLISNGVNCGHFLHLPDLGGVTKLLQNDSIHEREHGDQVFAIAEDDFRESNLARL